MIYSTLHKINLFHLILVLADPWICFFGGAKRSSHAQYDIAKASSPLRKRGSHALILSFAAFHSGEMKGCNNALYFETRKHKDLYMWVAKTPLGPSAKFLVQNIHTMGELKFTGNHLMGTHPFEFSTF